MTLFIKNMVCDRCIMIVRQQLNHLGFQVEHIRLGQVEIHPDPQAEQRSEIAATLGVLGFELIDKEKDQLVEQIKNEVIRLVHYTDLSELNMSLMHLIAEQLHKDYAYLSRLFSESEGLTIERYIIQQKIEKVKELLEYGELNLNEIAYKMGYSSNAHLSAQFKSQTGMSPSKYRSGRPGPRKPLDKIAG